MLKQLRLDILTPTGLVSRAKRAGIEKMFGGLFPAAVQVTLVQTRLDRGEYTKFQRISQRGSAQWGRAQMELFGAFVSARNGCVF